MITQAYDAKVAETKASRDPRLRKGNTLTYITTNPNQYKPTRKLTFHKNTNNGISRILISDKSTPELKVVPEPRKIAIAKKSAPKPRRYADAPLMNLKDLLPPGVNCDNDSSLNSTFRATRLEFIILACEDDNEDLDEDELEWEIPDQDTFDEAVGMAVELFTADDPDRIMSLSWSSTGWDTGVGLVALTTDNLQMIKEFREAISSVEFEGQRFLSMPKQMLLKKYALTIYFGRPFHRFTTARLMYWVGLCNDLKGEMDIVETRYFAKDHPNP